MRRGLRSLLDVNVLIALFDIGHIHHDRAHAWWRTAASGGWASCPLTQNGFVRVISQPKYPNAVSAAEACRRLRAFTLTSDHAFWAADISILDEERLDSERLLGPSQITDLYLLALAAERHGQLVTFDRGIPIAAIKGAHARHLLVL